MGLQIWVEIKGGDHDGEIFGVVDIDDESLKTQRWSEINDHVRGLCIRALPKVFPELQDEEVKDVSPVNQEDA